MTDLAPASPTFATPHAATRSISTPVGVDLAIVGVGLAIVSGYVRVLARPSIGTFDDAATWAGLGLGGLVFGLAMLLIGIVLAALRR